MIATAELSWHWAADIFPLMDETDYNELKADIAQNGLREEIVIYQGQILDGRNRYRACVESGVVPRFREHKGDHPVEFVVSLNLLRRHLNTSQRAVIAAELADLKQGGERSKAQNCALTHAQAAERLSVSPRQVDKASALLNAEEGGRAATDLMTQVRSGKMSLNKAEQIVRLGEAQQPGSAAQNDGHATPQSIVRPARHSGKRQFDQSVLQIELQCSRLENLVLGAGLIAELTPEHGTRLVDACRSAAQRLSAVAERLEQVLEGSALMQIEEERGAMMPIEEI
jgi:hypothetical protein